MCERLSLQVWTVARVDGNRIRLLAAVPAWHKHLGEDGGGNGCERFQRNAASGIGQYDIAARHAHIVNRHLVAVIKRYCGRDTERKRQSIIVVPFDLSHIYRVVVGRVQKLPTERILY